MSDPRSIKEIRRQLADLARVKAAAGAYGTPDFASQVGMRTVQWVSHPRINKHYYEFLEALAKQGANVRLRTRGNPFGVRVSARQARDRVDWLDLLQVEEETLSLPGTLVGGSVESGRFELK